MQTLRNLTFRDAEQFAHLCVEKSFANAIGLHPLTVDHKLRNAAFAGIANHVIGGARRGLNIDLPVGDFVPV